jgi:hypothetical protein
VAVRPLPDESRADVPDVSSNFQYAVREFATGAATDTVTDETGDVPPAPVQLIPYAVVAVGETLCVPEVAFAPANVPPVAVHAVALVELHERVAAYPEISEAGEAGSDERVAVGAGVTVVNVKLPETVLLPAASLEITR